MFPSSFHPIPVGCLHQPKMHSTKHNKNTNHKTLFVMISMNSVLWFVFYCVMLTAFVGWYGENVGVYAVWVTQNDGELIWHCVYRASYCSVLMTNEMHNSYNQVLFHNFLSAVHVSNESSRSSSGARHNILYNTVWYNRYNRAIRRV